MSQFGVQLHSRSHTKASGNGKRKIKSRDKCRSEIGSYFSATKMSEENAYRAHRKRGGHLTMVLKSAGYANLLTKQGYKKVKIKGVLESKDNRNFARQNTKESGLASIIPLQARKATVKGNVLLVGDAAGQVKATTGGGLVFGALCAKTAAEAIVNHLRNGAPLSMYDRMWRRRYMADLQMHRAIHRYYSSLGPRGARLLFRLARTLGVEGFLSEYGDMDSPRKVAKRIFVR
ncbi:MAG: lycopene cyclase family protein [Candidatus Marsarchaeota archaeon]|nr:lycopene cyclase family protein [Candidatus Marsarchaeota archaeon]